MKNFSKAKDFAFFCVILLLALGMIISGLQMLESTIFSSDQAAAQEPESKTITVDGVKYFPRQDITVVLVLGIDQEGIVESSGYYRNPGAADMAALMVFDDVQETCTVLSLNRDTMMDVRVLGLGGKRAGTMYGQLALAHTYGTGLADSCENTRDTIADFLGGIPIDYYVAMNMDAIQLLNDAVGGVTVNVTDDFSQVDPSIPMGSVTLKGEQAESYVRSRQGLGDQLNLSRMERQKEYVHSFLETFRTRLRESEAFALETYEQIQPYIVTDCTTKVLTGMMQRYSDFTLAEMISLPGENDTGGEYMEFHADKEAASELALELFFAPKS